MSKDDYENASKSRNFIEIVVELILHLDTTMERI